MRGVFSKGRPLASPVSWTGIYGFFLLTVFILWVPSSGYQNIVWPKHLLFLWATALFVLGLVPMVLIQKARQSLPERWTGADRLPLWSRRRAPAPIPAVRPGLSLSGCRLAGEPAV